MRKVSFNLLIAFQALVYGAGLLLATGLVERWGEWYAPWEAYRGQSRALIEGRLALSHDVADLRFNHTWSEGGVHQVWGLGVPAWRLPWDVLTRAFGHEAFPDRIAFGLFAALVAFVVLKVWLGPLVITVAGGESSPVNSGTRLTGAQGDSPWDFPAAVVAMMFLLLFPPWIGLLQSRGPAWEEPVAYLYLYGILLVTLSLSWMRHRSAGGWLCLCVLAGVGGFIRPTLVLYGLVTLGVGTFGWLRARPAWRLAIPVVLLGWLLFGMGGALLWWTNLQRFGDGFEFGHKLNVQHESGAMYATRFDDPFEAEPVSSAGRELVGALFRVRELNGTDFYRNGFIGGQSDTLRWRHFYFRTYDLSYAAWLLAGWGVAGLMIGRASSVRGMTDAGGEIWRSREKELAMMGVWSLLSSGLLAGFYLRVPVISSRYMLDFAPAFAVGMVVLWVYVARKCRRWWTFGLTGLLLAAWGGMELHWNRSLPGSAGSRRWDELPRAAHRSSADESADVKANGYVLGDPTSGIPFDRTGWDEKTGELKPLVILFVKDPEYLELELEHDADTEWVLDPGVIRAKVGLEPLRRAGMESTATGWRVRFEGPRQARYREGIQCVFVATVPKEHLTAAKTPWVLRSVRWREPSDLAARQSE